MKASEFCYWLQGFFEIAHASDDPRKTSLNSEQVEIVQRHLSLVFKHELDAQHGDAEHQAALNAIHNPAVPGLDDKPIMRC